MAEALRDAAGPNLTRATFIEFCTKHDEVERELADVAETKRSLNKRRKDIRKNMGAAGIDVDMFDRMRADLELTPEEREANARDLAQYMAWMQAPAGFQASMDFQSDDPGERAYNVHELHAIDGEGFDAGKTGRRADSNPYRPGTEGHARWHNAWNRGQQLAVESMGGGAPQPEPAAAANGHAAAPAPEAPPDPPEGKRRPGRPRKPHPSAAGENGDPPPMAAGAAQGEGAAFPEQTGEPPAQVH
jgi:hypothetical protein